MQFKANLFKKCIQTIKCNSKPFFISFSRKQNQEHRAKPQTRQKSAKKKL